MQTLSRRLKKLCTKLGWRDSSIKDRFPVIPCTVLVSRDWVNFPFRIHLVEMCFVEIIKYPHGLLHTPVSTYNSQTS